MEILKEIDFVRTDDFAVRRRGAAGGLDHGIRPRSQIVPAIAEQADDIVGHPAPEIRARLRLRDDPRNPAGLGIAADAVAVLADLGVPFHQQAAAVRTRPPVHVVGPVPGVGNPAGAPADAFPGIERSGPRPQRTQAVGQSLVFLGHRQLELQSVAPLQASGVIKAAQNGFGRHPAIAEIEQGHRDVDMAAADAADQAIELGRRPALFIGPDPITAVAAEAALEIGLVAGRRVGQIEVIIQHVQEGRPAGGGVGRPHIVGVIVVGDVKLLGLRPGRLAEDGRQQQGEDESKERAHLYPLHC